MSFVFSAYTLSQNSSQSFGGPEEKGPDSQNMYIVLQKLVLIHVTTWLLDAGYTFLFQPSW